MNSTVVRRIIISTIISAVLCFTGSILITLGNNETTQMTIIECLLKYDKSFFEQNSITLSNVVGTGLLSLWLNILLPFITSLPGLFVFADTMHGFWRMEYIRKSKRNYRIKKFFSICLYGAIPATLGYLLYVLILIPFFPYGSSCNTRNEEGVVVVISNAPPISEFIGNLALNMATLFLVAFITSALCLCIFLILKNRYKAVGIPLITYYLLYEVSLALYGKFIRDFRLFIISPYFVVGAGKYIMEAFSLPYVTLFIGLILIIAGFYILYYFLLNRRLEQ